MQSAPDAKAVLASIGEVIRAIAASRGELDDVLQTIIRSAVQLSRAEFGDILVPAEEPGVFQVVAYQGDVSDEYWRIASNRTYRPERGTLMGRVLGERRPVQIPDVLADPEYSAREMQTKGGYRSIVGVPMMRDGEVVGLFDVWRNHVEPFTDDEIALLTTFADQAVLALENVRLFRTVERQRTELARFAPQAAALLSAEGGEVLLAGHRREISAMFADLRGFTAFAETAEPEEVLGVLREYHTMVGRVVVAAGGNVEHFAGDGLMAFFNDPTPIVDHGLVAVRVAIDIRSQFGDLAAGWRKRGYELGLGIGMAVGFATLGRIGFEGRFDYGAVGNVAILASRLSDVAEPGQILISQRLNALVGDEVATDALPELTLKGFSRPVPAFSISRP
jgi:class 3 adenylate cyclase